jgi:UDP-N-acetylglucosamine acyltransferase
MIHKTAIVEEKSKIAKSVKIGAYSIIGPEVEIEDDVEIQSHVCVTGKTKIGQGTKIFPFASIGSEPQDLKFKGEKTSLLIGKNNVIREYVTINPGTEGGGGVTKVGNNCLFMISSHIAHDCLIGDNVVIANNVPLGGHVTVEDLVIIGGNSAVQQFTRIGRLAMVGGMTGVLKDIIPFGLSFGNRNYLEGLNLIGLRRNKYENKTIIELTEAYKKIFIKGNLYENVSKINGEYKENKLIQEVTQFIIKDKRRAICTPANIE